MKRLASCLLLAIAGIGGASAASFDCKKAVTRVEKLVCADASLSLFDEQLDAAYRNGLSRSTSPDAFRAAQRRWLATQRDACGDLACLQRAYVARVDALANESTANPSNDTLELGATRSRVFYAKPKGTCDGYPRLAIGMAKGYCAGLVAGPTQADPTRRIQLPRTLLQLDASAWLVSDLGGWTGDRGAVWRLRVARGQPTKVEPVLTGLKLPHTIARGPDGLVYVGEMSRISRFLPGAPDPGRTLRAVIANLPDNRLHENRHPLSSFIFTSDGALLVNVGAPSDQCADASGKALGKSCPQSDAGDQAASLRRYAPLGDGRWDPRYTIFARGLRNSIALAQHPRGTILQGENSIDVDARWSPFEEINVIQQGHHYGWPYCTDLHTPTPAWAPVKAMDCAGAASTPPALMLPPHAAPLALLWYQGAMFPELQGKLLVGWHGFRSVGGRIAAFATDADGVPLRNQHARFPVYGEALRAYGSPAAADAFILTPGWNKQAGVRPQGSPVGLTVADDGAIWTTDDRAGLVIRIAADRP